MGHVPHVLVPGPWHDTIEIDETQRRHLMAVLRLTDGAAVGYTDGAGTSGEGILSKGVIRRGSESVVERPTDVTLAVAPPSSRDRLRFVVEKASELGVAHLIWVETARTEGRLPPPAKADAWARGALEQSRGAWLTEISAAPLAEVVDDPDLVVADRGGLPAHLIAPGTRVVVLVGPEGGFGPGEIPATARRLTLGPTVLRVETAAVVAVALLARRGSPEGFSSAVGAPTIRLSPAVRPPA